MGAVVWFTPMAYNCMKFYQLITGILILVYFTANAKYLPVC
jgi:hypothetical protein